MEDWNVTRAIRDGFISAMALLALLTMLALIDDRVRGRVSDLAPEGIWDRVTDDQGQIATAGERAYSVILDHSGLTAFVVAASVLVVCMLRT